MFAPKQPNKAGLHPSKNKSQEKKPFVLQRQGLNAGIQEKLKVGQTNDRFEKEADSVADKVVSNTEAPKVEAAPTPPIQTMKVGSGDLTQRVLREPQSTLHEHSNKLSATPQRVDNEVQLQEEEEVQLKEEEVQLQEETTAVVETKKEEEVQLQEETTAAVELVETKAEKAPIQKKEITPEPPKPIVAPPIQLKTETPTEEEVQMKEDEEISEEAESVQMKSKAVGTGDDVSSQIASTKGSGSSMDKTIKGDMESGFGHDFSAVRIHTDSQAAQMSSSLGAKAFTTGNDIYFNEGEYRPESADGKHLLAHELTHTLQQGASEIQKSSQNIISNFKNEPETSIDEDQFGEASIWTSFNLSKNVDYGDIHRFAYLEYVRQVFNRFDDPGANFKDFSAVTDAPKTVSVSISTKAYLLHLFRTPWGDRDVKLLDAYLIYLGKDSPIKVDYSTVNENLHFLWEFPSLAELADMYFAIKESEKKRVSQWYENQSTEDDYVDDELSYNTVIRDETNIQPFQHMDKTAGNPKISSRPKLIQKVVNSTLELYGQSSNIGLSFFLNDAIDHQIDKSILKENAQTLEPDLYKTYLETQEILIKDSELYAELNVAREVYQEYWNIVGDIFYGSSKFKQIRQDSWDYESNLGGHSQDRNREMTDYYGSLAWDIIDRHFSRFSELESEYPQIPFGMDQFLRMWKIAGGFGYTYLANMPNQMNLNGETVKLGGIGLSDREVSDMLNSGLFSVQISLNNILDEREEGKEYNLNEQIASMVTQIETIEQTIRGIDYDLLKTNSDGTNAIPFPAVLTPKDSRLTDKTPIGLQLYFIKEGENEWKIIDFSNPTAKSNPTYSGTGSSDQEAMLSAVKNFATEAAYPKGEILGIGPEKYFGQEQRVKSWSTGENWDINMSEDLGIISTIAGVLGLVLVFTPLAPIGAGLLFVSGVTGATAAGLRIKDRIEHETFDLDSQTMMDVIDIVSGVIVAGKIANSGLKIVNKAAKGSKMAILTQAIETGADVASVVIIGNEYLQRIKDIENDASLSREQKDQQINALIQEAAAVGLLMLVGYAGPTIKRRFGKKRIGENIRKRINEQQKFELKYSDKEIDLIINEGLILGLDEKTIEDFIYIGSRETKRIKADDLIEQMNNWILVKKRGYPIGFESLEEFNIFKTKVKGLLDKAGIKTYNISVQGSSLRATNPKDIDIAVFLKKEDFDKYISRIRSNYSLLNQKAGKIIKNSKNFEKDLTKGKISSFHFENLPDGRTFEKGRFEELGNVDISIIEEGKKLDVSPYLNF